MKVRHGFVSNSSSSSFVVAWPQKPRTVEEMNGLLFEDKKEYENPYTWGDQPTGFPVSKVSEWLMNTLNWGKKKVREELVEDLKSEFSYLISQVSEKYGNGRSFTYTDGGKMVSCTTVAKRQMKKIIASLTKQYPRVNWTKRVQAIVDYRNKWHKVGEKLQNVGEKKFNDAELTLLHVPGL